jgi:RNA polymerase sigma-70 factor (ECF subfamily)
MLEDKLLVLKCKRGSNDGLCRIYEKYKDYLLTVARALVNEKTVAEDIVHDRDKIRAKKKQSKNPNPGNVVRLDLDNPEQQIIEREELTRLRQAISQLPYEQREAVVLHLKGGMKFRELAKLQGVSIGTIHGRYRYGLNKLRSLLNSEAIK